MVFILDSESVHLLNGVSDSVFLGVIDRNRGTIRIFPGAEQTSAGQQSFAGHRDLVRHGLARVDEVWGFSFEVASGFVRPFYRTSVLNHEFEDFAISDAMMNEVLAALSLVRTADFRSYP